MAPEVPDDAAGPANLAAADQEAGVNEAQDMILTTEHNQAQANASEDQPSKKLAPEGFPFEQMIKEALPKMKPTIAHQFEDVDGACEYFFILERENEKIQD